MSAAVQTPISLIESAFSRFQASVSAEDARNFHSTTLEDVRKAALELEREQRQRSALRNMKRIEPLLKGLEIYAKSLDVLCNGTPFLPWVWAPIKLMLQLATQFLSSFDRLMGAYVKIADALPRFDRYSASFPQSDFQNILALVYADIVEFHRRAYKFFRRKAWILLFETGWKSFELRFDGILGNLTYHRDLVDREASSFNIVEATLLRKKIEEDISKAEKERESSHLQAVFAWLCIDDLPQVDNLWRLKDKRSDGTCDWIFNASQYQNWVKNVLKGPWLWLTGIPGSGKSVCCAHVINTLRKDKNQSTLFYFCHHKVTDEDRPSAFLRTLVSQLVRVIPEFAALIWDTHVRNAHLPSIENLEKLLPNLISGASPVRIILDGLDEYTVSDYKIMLDALSKLSKKSPCGILISSRDEAIIETKMRNKPKISLRDEVEAIEKDMSVFVTARLDQAIRDWDLQISDDAQKAGQEQLLQKSKGMFLWVHLVIDSLQYSLDDEDFLQKIHELPETLQAAYDRIVHKILSAEDRRIRRKMTHLLEWITYVQKPLSVDELLSALALDVMEPRDHLPRPSTPKLLEFCKPIIEIPITGLVDFVHFSAREYFRDSSSKYHISKITAHLMMSDVCLAYLNTTSVFLREELQNERLQQIVIGQRAIHRYSTDHWYRHLSECLNHDDVSEKPEFAALTSKVRAMKWIYKSTDQGEVADVATIVQTVNAFKEEILRKECSSENPAEIQETRRCQDPTYLSQIAEQYEADIEILFSCNDEALPMGIDKADMVAFRRKFFAGAFRCRYQGCSDKTNLAFQSIAERQKHELTHLPQFQCHKSYCIWKDIGFKKRRELEAHMRRYHPDIMDGPSLDIPRDKASDPRTGHGPAELMLEDVPDYLKLTGSGWHAIFNPKVPRFLSVTVLYDIEHESTVLCAAFSSDGHLLATGCNRAAMIFGASSGRVMSKFDHPRFEETYRDNLVRSVCFSPNNEFLVTGSEDGYIWMWDISDGTIKSKWRAHDQEINGISFAPNGRFIASCSNNGSVILWDAETSDRINGPFDKAGDDGLYDVTISPDCELVGARGLICGVYVWNVSTGRPISVLRESILDHHLGSVTSVHFSPTGRYLLTASLDKTAKIWDTAAAAASSSSSSSPSGTALLTLKGHTNAVWDAKYTRDKKWVLSGSSDQTVIFWDAQSGIPYMVLTCHDKPVLKLVLSPNKEFAVGEGIFATRFSDGSLRIWHYYPYQGQEVEQENE